MDADEVMYTEEAREVLHGMEVGDAEVIGEYTYIRLQNDWWWDTATNRRHRLPALIVLIGMRSTVDMKTI